jgi:predicted PurR-regulated permease PerM
LAALGWILLIHFIEANILNPQIIGTSAHIHPVIVIFALLAGESTFGLVGALLAVPVASIILELFKFVRDKIRTNDGAPGADAVPETSSP